MHTEAERQKLMLIIGTSAGASIVVGPIFMLLAFLFLVNSWDESAWRAALGIMFIVIALLLNGYGFFGLVVGLPVIATLKLLPANAPSM